MNPFRIFKKTQSGFSLIEVIITLVVGAIVGVMFLSYMGISLSGSGDPINIARDEALTEQWMERIISDYVKEMNSSATYATALATIKNGKYTITPYNMPASITLTRAYITYNTAGNEVISGGASTNLKVTIKAVGYPMTAILTAERTSDGDQMVYY